MNIFFDIFQKYGWGGILGIIICIILYFLFKAGSKKLSKEVKSGLEQVGEKLTDQMIHQNESLTKGIEDLSVKLTDQMTHQNEQLSGVIIEQQNILLNHLLEEKKNEHNRHNRMINEKEDLAVDINNYLKVVKNIYNCQRAYILEFHNHNENLSGTPFVKFTCKYEWFELKDGYEPLIGNCKDMAFASIAQIIKEVRQSENQCMIYNDMEKFSNENPSISYYLINDKTKSFVFKGLFDKNNIFIAVLVLEYNYNVKYEDINLNKLHIQAQELVQLINLRYKYEEPER